MLEELQHFYSDTGPERVGFILTDGAIVEVENVSNNPEESFDVCAEDLITFGDRAIASWHTHPGVKMNLSTDDYSAFLSWSDLQHYVIGHDGIRLYSVDGNNTIVQASNPSPRPAQEALS